MGGLLHWKRTEIRVFFSSVIPSPVIPFQRLPGQLTRAQTLIAPFVFPSPIKEPSFGWRPRSAEHLRPPHVPRSPEGAARAPREADTPGGRLDPELPNAHRRQRATRGFLPLRTRQRPHATGTSCCSAPRDTQRNLAQAPPCSPRPLLRSRQRGSHRLLSGGGGHGATPRLPRRARHCTAPPRPLGQGRTAPRAPGGPLGRLPRRHRPSPRDGSGTRHGPRPPGQ